METPANPAKQYNRIANVSKIAVLRANGIGDYVMAAPALEALRAAYPDAEIVLLGQPWHHRFLAGRPGPVDRVIVCPPAKGIGEGEDYENDDQQLEAFFREMQRERFDLAIQLHGGGGNSNPFVKSLGARHTAGLRAANAPPLERWLRYFYFQHEVLRYLETVALVGAAPVTLQPTIAVTDQDRWEAEAVLPTSPSPLVVIHPSASDPRRRWPAEKFAAVGDALVDIGAEVAVIGNQAERELAQSVVDAMRCPARNLAGEISLNGTAGLLARAALLVGNDSGPGHLAEAVGAPTVRVYWCGNLLNAGPAWRSKHRPVVSWQIHCSECGSDCMTDPCTHRTSFVAGVSVDEVRKNALDLLTNREGTEAPDMPSSRPVDRDESIPA